MEHQVADRTVLDRAHRRLVFGFDIRNQPGGIDPLGCFFVFKQWRVDTAVHPYTERLIIRNAV